MAMSKGSVTIAGDGTASGSGAAKALYDVLVTKYPTIEAGAPGVPAKQRIADICISVAELIDYIKDNGEVTTKVGTSDNNLQRTPDPNDPNTNTTAPSATRTLAIKGTIG